MSQNANQYFSSPAGQKFLGSISDLSASLTEVMPLLAWAGALTFMLLLPVLLRMVRRDSWQQIGISLAKMVLAGLCGISVVIIFMLPYLWCMEMYRVCIKEKQAWRESFFRQKAFQ